LLLGSSATLLAYLKTLAELFDFHRLLFGGVSARF
jgi:hypothetical protein